MVLVVSPCKPLSVLRFRVSVVKGLCCCEFLFYTQFPPKRLLA